MPLRVDQLPPDAKTLSRRLLEVERQLREGRAARVLEAANIGAGGLSVQAAALTDGLFLTPSGALTVTQYGVGAINPAALQFQSTAIAEAAAGAFLGYLADGGGYPVPTWLLVTPDLGAGTAALRLQAGAPGHTTGVAELDIGTAQLLLTATGLTLQFGATTFALTAAGLSFTSESPVVLAMANGWAAAGGTWAAPTSIHKSDQTIMLQGSAIPGTLTAGTQITTVPTPPAADLEYRVSGGSATAACDLVIHGTTGAVNITNIAGTITRISLSNIRYAL